MTSMDVLRSVVYLIRLLLVLALPVIGGFILYAVHRHTYGKGYVGDDGSKSSFYSHHSLGDGYGGLCFMVGVVAIGAIVLGILAPMPDIFGH